MSENWLLPERARTVPFELMADIGASIDVLRRKPMRVIRKALVRHWSLFIETSLRSMPFLSAI